MPVTKCRPESSREATVVRDDRGLVGGNDPVGSGTSAVNYESLLNRFH